VIALDDPSDPGRCRLGDQQLDRPSWIVSQITCPVATLGYAPEPRPSRRTIPANGVMALHGDEIPGKDLPARPVMLGEGGRSRFGYLRGVSLAGLTAPRYDFMTSAMHSIRRRVRIDNSNSVLMTFDPLDLYPEETAALEEIWLFANSTLVGTTLVAEWIARSRDASGVLRDTLQIEVDRTLPGTEELLSQAEGRVARDDDE
jgi:hypothetical protein